MFYGVFCYQEGSLLKSCLRDYGWREESKAHVRLSARRSRVMVTLQLPSATPTPDRLPDPDPILPPVSRSSPSPAEGILPDSATAVLLSYRSRQSLPAAFVILAAGQEPCMAAWKEPCKRCLWFVFIALVFKLHGVSSLQLFLWRNGGRGENLTNIVKLDLGLDLGLWL